LFAKLDFDLGWDVCFGVAAAAAPMSWDRDYCLGELAFLALTAGDANTVRRSVADAAPRPAIPQGLHRTRVVDLPNLWSMVHDYLQGDRRHAVEFAEQAIHGLGALLIEDRTTGLFVPFDPSAEPLRGKSPLLDAWNHAQDKGWDFKACAELGKYAVSEAEAMRIVDAASATREPPVTVGQATTEADHPFPSRWPWGAHETELLRQLAAAADRFWSRFDPADNTTAPTNEQVSAWLQSRGVAARTAEVIATILRADGLPTGPRK
jgi:hypothetical protein